MFKPMPHHHQKTAPERISTPKPDSGVAAHRSGSIWPFLLLLGLVLVAAIVVSTGMGYIQIGWQAVLRVIFAKIFFAGGLIDGIDPLIPAVVWEVRLPRILTAALVGGGLAVSGVVFQGILINPLADPYTLGVSAGAAFGAALALLLGVTLLGIYTLPLFAFAGAVATLLAVLALASGGAKTGGTKTGRISGDTYSANHLILAGIIVAAILSAGISFLKFVADEQVGVIIFWLMGSFAAKTWVEVGLTAGFVTIGVVVSLFYSRDLNLLALGARTAASLGVDLRRTPMILLVAASLLAAACVSVAGIIAFVGLLIPHLMRTLAGPDNRHLLPASLLAGALLLLLADTLTRAVLPREIPIGVLTALLGGPFFCYIFRRRQQRGREF
jgi:iron complex transport system permease protein